MSSRFVLTVTLGFDGAFHIKGLYSRRQQLTADKEVPVEVAMAARGPAALCKHTRANVSTLTRDTLTVTPKTKKENWFAKL